MDWLITAVRFPIGALAIVIVAAFWVGLFILETLAALVSLVFMAIAAGRRDVKQSWLTGYPHSLPRIPTNCSKIWGWIFADDAPSEENSFPASYLVIGAVIAIVIGVVIVVSVVNEQSRTQRIAPYKAPIEKVLADDRDVGRRVNRTVPGFQSQMAASMRRIDLNNCPLEFQRAFQAHIDAWEGHNEPAIRDSFYEVLRIAREYGVDTSEFK
jgi:hypothetical protein